MRKKYNIFDVFKVNLRTIRLAVALKKQQEKTIPFKEVNVQVVSNPSYVPLDNNNLLGYLSYKYLYLKPEDGIPLLKQAYKQQYKIEDEYKECRQCGRLFRFDKKSKVFCSSRCRQRFYRNQKRREKRS